MHLMHTKRLTSLWSALITSIALTVTCGQHAMAQIQLAPPTNVEVDDKRWDGGQSIVVSWQPSADDPGRVKRYLVTRALSHDGLAIVERELGEEIARFERRVQNDPDDQFAKKELCKRRQDLAAAKKNEAVGVGDVAVQDFKEGTERKYKLVADTLDAKLEYVFHVVAAGEGDVKSAMVTTAAISPRVQFFDGTRAWLLLIVTIICGSVVSFIMIARSGVPLKIRRIAGLEAVDEAVGRATEMGRPILFVPGIQDMNDMMTLAGLTALGHVAKRAAEYDAKLEVPTSKSLVMTAARETVQGAFLAAGRPDAYNQDLIYYVTDEQFGYVAYLSGHMVREKPAACFYLGAFFAESLILAETGNAVGAIQIAGTAETAQLPFFVAACDYTLIGEEFYAASAYLSGEPDQLGSLRGQDVGKLIVAIGLILGCLIATGAALTPPDKQTWFDSAYTYLKEKMLR